MAESCRRCVFNSLKKVTVSSRAVVPFDVSISSAWET